MIMASENLTDQHWEAARLAIHGASREGVEVGGSNLGEPKEILAFLDYHLGLQGAGEDHGPSIESASHIILTGLWCRWTKPPPLIAECISKFNCASPSFVGGVRSLLRPDRAFRLRRETVGLVALISDQWFNSPAPIMEPEEMSEFCEHLAVLVIDDAFHGPLIQRCGVTILFEMLRSPGWRKQIVPRFWRMFSYSTKADGMRESVKWCLQNAIELLEFMRGLPDGEGLKWWYGALWFHYDKLDTTVRDEVEKVARDMWLSDGLSADLILYHDLIGQELARMRQDADEISKRSTGEDSTELRIRLVTLESNSHKLSQITGRR